ncbi:MAG: hypothetical protein KC964_01855 [Candidatus Omnitrophica bacterium]|nr:hypothetical protein [Candidatus Omnitrophota bacterium]
MAGKKKKNKNQGPMDPKTREHLEECVQTIKEFIEKFRQFYWQFRRAYLGEPVTTDAERKFLRMKSEIARHHQYLFEQVGRDYIGGTVLTDFLRTVVNLEKVSKTQSSNYYKIEKFWHEIDLNLEDSLVSIQFRLDQEDQS